MSTIKSQSGEQAGALRCSRHSKKGSTVADMPGARWTRPASFNGLTVAVMFGAFWRTFRLGALACDLRVPLTFRVFSCSLCRPNRLTVPVRWLGKTANGSECDFTLVDQSNQNAGLVIAAGTRRLRASAPCRARWPRLQCWRVGPAGTRGLCPIKSAIYG